jgi:hypothetical protein
MTGDGDDDTVYPDAEITIVTQPQDTEVEANTDATFSVVATVIPGQTLDYQWFNADGDVELVGETSDELVLEDVQLEDSGNTFYVVVTAGDVSVQSANAELTVVAPEPEPE